MTLEGFLRKSSNFWLSPLLIGGCIGVGYSSTQRIIVHKILSNNINYQLFSQVKPFPGESLKKLESQITLPNPLVEINSNRIPAKQSIKDERLRYSLERKIDLLFNSLDAVEFKLTNDMAIELKSKNNQKLKGRKFDSIFQSLTMP